MAYYHVRITQKSDPSSMEVKLDFTREELELRILQGYRLGHPITVGGKSIEPDDIERVRISTTDQLSTNYRVRAKRERIDSGIISFRPVDWDIARMGKDVTEEFITGPPGGELRESAIRPKKIGPPADTREVFVVHGRNQKARNALFDFLRSINLRPLEWSEAVKATGKTMPYIGEVLDTAFSRAHAVVVLFTPDDEARLKEQFRVDSDPPHETELTGQSRPNVLFEAGMAMGRNQEGTLLVELGRLRPFSDMAGLYVIRLDDTSQRRQELAQRLQTAGCPVNLDGTDWHTVGDFDDSVGTSDGTSAELTAIEEQQPVIAQPRRLSEEAKELLIDAAKDRVGINRVKTFGGTAIVTNGKNFGEMGNRPTEARWEGALNDLVGAGFVVEDGNGEGGLFEVTREGFEYVNALEGHLESTSDSV